MKVFSYEQADQWTEGNGYMWPNMHRMGENVITKMTYLHHLPSGQTCQPDSHEQSIVLLVIGGLADHMCRVTS